MTNQITIKKNKNETLNIDEKYLNDLDIEYFKTFIKDKLSYNYISIILDNFNLDSKRQEILENQKEHLFNIGSI